jgi:hypothetical protein
VFEGLMRVAGGLLGTLAVFAFYVVVLPVSVMLVALYIARLWPLTRRRR